MKQKQNYNSINTCLNVYLLTLLVGRNRVHKNSGSSSPEGFWYERQVL